MHFVIFPIPHGDDLFSESTITPPPTATFTPEELKHAIKEYRRDVAQSCLNRIRFLVVSGLTGKYTAEDVSYLQRKVSENHVWHPEVDLLCHKMTPYEELVP